MVSAAYEKTLRSLIFEVFAFMCSRLFAARLLKGYIKLIGLLSQNFVQRWVGSGRVRSKNPDP